MVGHESKENNGLNGFFMKAMTRTKLAECAGVSRKTLCNFIEAHVNELRMLGLRSRNILPPKVVEWIVENYGIDVDDQKT